MLTLAHSIGVIYAVAWSLKVSSDVAAAISEGRRFHTSFIEKILEVFGV